MEIKIKKLYDDAIIPTRGSYYAAGYDLYAHIFYNLLIILTFYVHIFFL